MKTLILLITLSLLLPACNTLAPLNGFFTSNTGYIKVNPDGRFEIIIEPRSSK